MLLFIYLWPCHASSEVLAPQPGIEHAPCIGSAESQPTDYQGSSTRLCFVTDSPRISVAYQTKYYFNM